MRNLFLKYALLAEQEFKTHVAYEFAQKSGETNWDLTSAYGNMNTKKHKTEVKNLIKLLNKEASKTKKDSQDDLVKHFSKIPIWAFVNVFSLGLIKKFYFCMEPKDRNKIANKYYNKISFSCLRSFLESLNMFRNVFAHNFRILFYRIKDIDKQIKNTPIHSKLNIKKDNNRYIAGKNDLFSIVIVFRYMLSEKDFKFFYDDLTSLFDDYKKKADKISYKQVIETIGFFEDSDKRNWRNINKIKIL